MPKNKDIKKYWQIERACIAEVAELGVDGLMAIRWHTFPSPRREDRFNLPPRSRLCLFKNEEEANAAQDALIAATKKGWVPPFFRRKQRETFFLIFLHEEMDKERIEALPALEWNNYEPWEKKARDRGLPGFYTGHNFELWENSVVVCRRRR